MIIQTIRRLIRNIKRRYTNKFISVDDMFYPAHIQKGVYTPNHNKVNVVIGCLLVGYGGVTVLLPTGSIPCIMLGLFLISCPLSLCVLMRRLYKDVTSWVGVRW